MGSAPFRRHVRIALLLLSAMLVGCLPANLLAEDVSAPLFYASFDKRVLADEAAGDPAPLEYRGSRIASRGRKGRALALDWGAHLSFAARGNIYPERGTLAFWWQLEEPPGETPFSIVRVSTQQWHSPGHAFAHLSWTGKALRLQLFDRDSTVLPVDADGTAGVVAGRWFFLAFSWHELDGIRFYVDGREVGNHPGRHHFGRWLDQIGIHTQVLTPSRRQGNERKALVDEFRIFAAPLSHEAIGNLFELGAGRSRSFPREEDPDSESLRVHRTDRFGWNNPDHLPQVAASTSFRTVRILSARDVRRPSLAGVDGSSESAWPPPEKGYRREGRILRIGVADEPFNTLRLRGTFRGTIHADTSGSDRLLWDLSGPGNGAITRSLGAPVSTPSIQVERHSGHVRELTLLLVNSRSHPGSDPNGDGALTYRLMPSEQAAGLPGQPARTLRSLYGRSLELRRRYLPRDREAWVAVPEEIYQPPPDEPVPARSLRYRHIILPPFLRDTVVTSVEVGLETAPPPAPSGSTVRWAIKDPLLPGRNLMLVDFRMPRDQPASVLLDLADTKVPAGQALWMTVASDRIGSTRDLFEHARIQVHVAPPGQPSETPPGVGLFADRFLLIRERLRQLTRSLDWMSMDFASARRQFGTVDEVSRLVNDVLESNPKDLPTLAFKGLLEPDTKPPEFREKKLPRPIHPEWAVQQNRLMAHFKHLARWWITNRQVEEGEFGGGLDQDTRLVTHWPGIALMDGPADDLRDSLARLMEACLRSGNLENGLNHRLATSRQAYRAGLNLVPLLALLDYGNPRWIEMLMRTSRHLDRLTAINPADHRHFQSSLLSASTSIRTGYYAREARFSPLLWHAALALAGYNHSPLVIRWLREYADGRLDHWKKDRHPELSRAIHFPSDQALSWGLPGLPLLDLMWGVFRVTGEKAYLWPVRRLVQFGEMAQAQLVSGRWQSRLEEGSDSSRFLNLIPELPIWNRHLNYREAGLLARQFAYEATGQKRYLLDYQAALLKHLEQNRVLHTEAELSPGGVFIPHRATQRVRLGGIAHAANQLHAGHAVSWENTSGQVAVLVSVAKPDALEVTAVNLGNTLPDVRLRVWQLENGTYEVTVGRDADDDGQTELLIDRMILKLKRHSVIPLTLRGGKSTIVKARQLRRGTPIGQLPDLAVGPEDFRYDTGPDRGTVTIHNIGSADSTPFKLRIESATRAVLVERELESLPAPLDLHPKTRVVPLTGLQAAGPGPFFLHLLPNAGGEEITTENNRLTVSLTGSTPGRSELPNPD